MTTTATAAPAAPVLAAPPVVQRLPLDALRPSPKNPRRIRDDDPKLQELVQSLRSLGQIEPIVVRAIAADPDGIAPAHYEVLAGGRRLRAAQLGGLVDLECKVLTGIDDHTALEITVVENLQRADLHPLEEALGVAALLDDGRSVEEIARNLGKSVRWVYLRAKLRDLVPQWRELLDVPDDIASRLSAGHLELIARMAPEVQAELLKERVEIFGDMGDDMLVAPVEDCAERIAREYLRELGSAPWKLDDETLLVSAGPCTTCPKRSACQQELFADLAGGKKPKDRCLDAGCWDSKRAAWLKQREAEAIEKHGDEVIRVAAPAHVNDVGEEQPKSIKGVVPSNEVKEARAGERGAKPALIVSGPDQGKVKWVKPDVPSYRSPTAATAKAFGLEKKAAAGDSATTRQEERAREERERKRSQHVGKALAEALRKAPVPMLTVVAELAWLVGVDAAAKEYEKNTKRWTSLGTAREHEIAPALWRAACDAIEERFSYYPPEDAAQALPALAALGDIDLPALQAAALKKYPDPAPAKVTSDVEPAKGEPKGAKAATAKKPAKAKAVKPAKKPAAKKAKKGKA